MRINAEDGVLRPSEFATSLPQSRLLNDEVVKELDSLSEALACSNAHLFPSRN
jgi:hypothetical protein